MNNAHPIGDGFDEVTDSYDSIQECSIHKQPGLVVSKKHLLSSVIELR
ncbi:MAG: hypothetical protein GXO35_06605 [Gammaproteobacteria bacterium]|nr:hypothetical protein [Gammaproteobacteria bacterium]